MERGHHLGLLDSYLYEISKNVKVAHYRMCLYSCKKKIQQCEILLAHTGSITSLWTPPPLLAESVRSPVDPA